jgi:hypothetical protein
MNYIPCFMAIKWPIYGITRRQSQYGNDSLTKGVKQIIQHMGQW